jgi:hypothetical protein
MPSRIWSWLGICFICNSQVTLQSNAVIPWFIQLLFMKGAILYTACVCAHACMHVCMYVCMYVCVCVCVCVYIMYACMCVMYVCMYVMYM